MATRLTLAIQEHYEELSASERKLATLLLDRADDLLTYSATELATMASVSKATAARLFRSLGYVDFNEVKLQAREERNLAQPFQHPRHTTPATEEPKGYSIPRHLQVETDSLARTFESLRHDTLGEAANRLAKAPRVWLLGVGLDEGLTRFMRPQLARVRPEVFCLGDQSGALAEDLAMTRHHDALLLVLTQPRPRNLEKLIPHLTTTRVELVCVVDVRNAAWARRISRMVLPCYSTSTEHAFSAMAAASMLHLLMQATAERIGKRAEQRSIELGNLSAELESD